MGNTLIDRQLQHLGIDHDKAQLFRRGLVEHGEDHDVHPYRLARASSPRHQQVGHLGKIDHHRFTGDILAQHHGQRAVGITKTLRIEHFLEIDGLPLGIGQFDTDIRLARDHLHNPHTDRREGTGQVAGETGDLARLHAWRQIQLETGNNRPRIDTDHASLDVIIRQLGFNQSGNSLQLLLRHTLGLDWWRIEQIDRG